MAKKKPTSFPATHELGELLIQAAAEMEAHQGWDQHGERPTDVARAFVDLLFETDGKKTRDDFAEAREKDPYHSDPEIMGGTPVFCGTQVPVSCLFDWLGKGAAIDTFVDHYPTVSREAAISVLASAKRLLEEDAYFSAELAR